MKKTMLTLFAILLAISLVQGQENQEKKENTSKREKLHVALKEGADPDIYVDGKKFDFPMELLDKNRIESVNVLTSDSALRDYNAKNGVVLITTKKNFVEPNESEVTTIGPAKERKTPMIIINGEKSSQDVLKKLSPDAIESIEVFKDEQALQKYNAPNGVIVVKTKKGKQK